MPWTALACLCRVQDWLHNTGWTLIVIILFADYPCPLFSSRTRPSVYGEVGHTIMNLLAVCIYPTSWVKINAVTEPSFLLFDSQAKWRSTPPPPPTPVLPSPTSLGRPDALINQEGYENSRPYFHKIRCLGQFLMPACFCFIFQLWWRYKTDVEYMYNTWSCYSHCINGTPITPACSYIACFIWQKTLLSTQACWVSTFQQEPLWLLVSPVTIKPIVIHRIE